MQLFEEFCREIPSTIANIPNRVTRITKNIENVPAMLLLKIDLGYRNNRHPLSTYLNSRSLADCCLRRAFTTGIEECTKETKNKDSGEEDVDEDDGVVVLGSVKVLHCGVTNSFLPFLLAGLVGSKNKLCKVSLALFVRKGESAPVISDSAGSVVLPNAV